MELFKFDIVTALKERYSSDIDADLQAIHEKSEELKDMIDDINRVGFTYPHGLVVGDTITNVTNQKLITKKLPFKERLLIFLKGEIHVLVHSNEKVYIWDYSKKYWLRVYKFKKEG